MITIALYNLKGGVGKTAGCVNLAHLAAMDEYRTLIWDLDPQGAAGFYYQASAGSAKDTRKLVEQHVAISELIQHTGYDYLDIIPSDFSSRKLDSLLEAQGSSKKYIKQLLKPLKNDYDLVFIDCPPGFSVLAEHIFQAADIVLLPTIPTTLSLRTFEAVKSFFEEKKIDLAKLMCYFSMVDSRKALHLETMEAFHRQRRFFSSYIPYLSDVEKMGIYQAPVMAFAPSSRAAQAYTDLWEELKEGIF
ncbi:Sporulation initiation inhibitor protein Soj [compost metagenome]